jgi:ribonuclease G
VNTVCNEIFVEMRKISKHLEHADVMLRVNPEVAKALKAQGSRWLNEMEELTKRTIIVKSDPALHQEQFDIN